MNLVYNDFRDDEAVYLYIFGEDKITPSRCEILATTTLDLEDFLDRGYIIYQEVVDARNKEFFSTLNYESLKINYTLYHPKYKILILCTSKKNTLHITNIYYGDKDEFYSLLELIAESTILLEENQVYFITTGYSKLTIDGFDFKPFNIDIKLNYEDNFVEFDKLIVNKLKEKTSGIHFLYGGIGSGKTSYIKHLISHIDKKFIYCPPHMVSNLSSPDFITLMMNEGSDSILIIEDAEEVLVSREHQYNPAISNILNLGSGILGHATNIQIIATFNTDISKIDLALLRKGRLLTEYEFTNLSVDKANKLAKHINIDVTFIDPQPLSEIYNYLDKGHTVTKKTDIGF